LHPVHQVKAVNAGHSYIGYDDIGYIIFDYFQQIFAIAETADIDTCFL
jgi:hypothetical protein